MVRSYSVEGRGTRSSLRRNECRWIASDLAIRLISSLVRFIEPPFLCWIAELAGLAHCLMNGASEGVSGCWRTRQCLDVGLVVAELSGGALQTAQDRVEGRLAQLDHLRRHPDLFTAHPATTDDRAEYRLVDHRDQRADQYLLIAHRTPPQQLRRRRWPRRHRPAAPTGDSSARHRGRDGACTSTRGR